MSSTTLWFEVDKANQAILSYFLVQPTTPSDKVDYVEATAEELIFLNALEDAVLPAGMVVTIDDLYTHRARVHAAHKAKQAVPFKATPAAPQQPAKATKAATPVDDSLTITNFKNGFKSVRKQTKGNYYD